MEKIRLRLPGMMRIWEESSIARGLKDNLEDTFAWEQEYRRGIEECKYTMESEVTPERFLL